MESQSVENYLKTIYLLDQQGTEKVSATALASTLGVNPPSIIDMLKKLRGKKFIRYDKSSGVKLTSSGAKAALLTVRKHRLWEMFLQMKLGYAWDEVHDIAEQLEHVQEKTLADRLADFLGDPDFDPHGEPIPSTNGTLPDISQKMLSEINDGEVCRVASVKDTSKSFLQYLLRLNIGIGTTIKLLDRIEFDDSLNILIDSRHKATVSKKFAESLFVS